MEFELNTDWSLLGLFSEANLFPKVVCLFFILQEDGWKRDRIPWQRVWR